MRKIKVLIAVREAAPSADFFRKAISRRNDLTDRVDYGFCGPEEIVHQIADVEVVTCGNLRGDALSTASDLRWIAFWSAGLDGKISREMIDRQLLLTNASGVHGPNIAEHVLCMMLMFTRRMHIHIRSQAGKVWDRQMPVDMPPAGELSGQTLGIIGYGRIGEALTTRAHSMGMRVVATKRDTSFVHSGDNVTKPDKLYSPGEMKLLLGQSDHICIAVPSTTETSHLINREVIAAMKPGAYVYNVARGAVADEAALIEALRSEHLGGAGLDVFETEPLPVDSPLWDMPNVIITPHVAGLTPHYFPRYAELFAANLERYVVGLPLHNQYRDDLGY